MFKHRLFAPVVHDTRINGPRPTLPPQQSQAGKAAIDTEQQRLAGGADQHVTEEAFVKDRLEREGANLTPDQRKDLETRLREEFKHFDTNKDGLDEAEFLNLMQDRAQSGGDTHMAAGDLTDADKAALNTGITERGEGVKAKQRELNEQIKAGKIPGPPLKEDGLEGPKTRAAMAAAAKAQQAPATTPQQPTPQADQKPPERPPVPDAVKPYMDANGKLDTVKLETDRAAGKVDLDAYKAAVKLATPEQRGQMLSQLDDNYSISGGEKAFAEAIVKQAEADGTTGKMVASMQAHGTLDQDTSWAIGAYSSPNTLAGLPQGQLEALNGNLPTFSSLGVNAYNDAYKNIQAAKQIQPAGGPNPDLARALEALHANQQDLRALQAQKERELREATTPEARQAKQVEIQELKSSLAHLQLVEQHLVKVQSSPAVADPSKAAALKQYAENIRAASLATPEARAAELQRLVANESQLGPS